MSRRSCAALVAAFAASTLAAPAAQADFIDHFAVKDDVGDHKVPRVGTSRILVLVVQVEGFPPHDMDHIRAHYEPEPTPGELRFTDFHERMSLGAFRPEATVVGPLIYERCPLPEDYEGYEDCRIPRGLGDNVTEILSTLNVGLVILEDFFQRADAELGVDFSEFDVNGVEGQPDGWIDGIILLHNIDFGGYAIPYYFLRQGGPLELDGVKLNVVGMADTAEVAVHEFGHLLGWADLYDEIGGSKGLQYSHMGSWYYDSPIPAIDAWSRALAGWTQPTTLDLGQSMTDVRLRPAADSGDAIVLNAGDERFVLENRGALPDDYIDGDIRERGLAIYHINTRRAPGPNPNAWPLRLGAGCVNCSVWDPFIMNEQADGKFELQLPGTRRDDRGDLFREGDALVPDLDNTDPLGPRNKTLSSNRYNGAVSGVSVTNIRIDGDDILVDVAIDEPCSLLQCGEGTCEAGKCIPPDEPANNAQPNNDQPANNANNTNNAANNNPDPNPAQTQEDEGCATTPAQPSSPLLPLLLLASALTLPMIRRRAAKRS